MNDMAMALSQMGRGMDDRMAHVAPGEIVIPRQVIDRQPQLLAAIIKAFQKASNGQVDWRKFVVGTDEDRKNANPETGLSDFDFDSAADGFGMGFGAVDDPGSYAPGMGGADVGVGGFDATGNDSIETAAMGPTEPGIVDFGTQSQTGSNSDGASFFPDYQVPPPFENDDNPEPDIPNFTTLETLEKSVPEFLIEEASRDTGRSTLPPQDNRNFIDRAMGYLPGIGGIKRLIDMIPDDRSAAVIDQDNQIQADLEAASAGMVGGSPSPSPVGLGPEAGAQLSPTPSPVTPMPTATPTPNQIMGPRFVRPAAITEPRLLGIPSDMDELQRRAMIATYGVNADEGKWRDPFTVEYYKNLIARSLIDDAGNALPLNLLPIEEQYLREVGGIDVPPTSEGLLDILTGKTATADRTAIEQGIGGGGNDLLNAFQSDPALAQLLVQLLAQRPRTATA